MNTEYNNIFDIKKEQNTLRLDSRIYYFKFVYAYLMSGCEGTQFSALDWEEGRLVGVIVANITQNRKKSHCFYIALGNS
jgi:hypothetical protein